LAAGALNRAIGGAAGRRLQKLAGKTLLKVCNKMTATDAGRRLSQSKMEGAAKLEQGET
jgi:hypothetical protein